MGISEAFPPEAVRLILFDFHSRTLSNFQRFCRKEDYIGIKSELPGALERLQTEINHRAELSEKAYEPAHEGYDPLKFLESLPQIVVAIDDYETFSYKIDNNVRGALTNCLISGEELGITFIITGDLSKLPREYGGSGTSFLERVKQQGCGVLLGGSEGADQFNSARIPSFQRATTLPAGRGYIIQRGQGRLFQAYAYWTETEDPRTALEKRLGKTKARIEPGSLNRKR
jgi:hypothetical protein